LSETSGPTLATYDWLGFDRVDSRSTGLGGSLVQDWGWDGYKRLETLDGGATLSLAYGFDGLDRRTFKDHLQPDLDADVYVHDGGSRLEQISYGAPNPPSTLGGDPFDLELSGASSRLSTTFQSQTTDYNGGGGAVDALHLYLSVGGHDGRGNLTSDGSLAYAYDPWNRLKSVSAGGVEHVRYEHDALGRRVREVTEYPSSGTVERQYVYAGPRLLEQWEGPDAQSTVLSGRYVYGVGLDELVSFEDGPRPWTRTRGRNGRQDGGARSASALRQPAEGTLLAMDDATRKALEAIDAAVAAKPPEGPIVLSEEYLRLVRRVEELPENKPGTDKTWTERVVDEWKHLVESAREIPPG